MRTSAAIQMLFASAGSFKATPKARYDSDPVHSLSRPIHVSTVCLHLMAPWDGCSSSLHKDIITYIVYMLMEVNIVQNSFTSLKHIVLFKSPFPSCFQCTQGF